MEASLVLSDTHLSPKYGQQAARDLARLLETYTDLELILAGDIFDLSLHRTGVPFAEGAALALAQHPELLSALTTRLERGCRVTFIPGNHDATVASGEASVHLKRLLQLGDERQLEVSPWFVRRGVVHLEHGHLYDPDCAPNHPLADHDPSSEGLGTALMRRFIAPHDAFFFAHAHTTTPVTGLRKAFEKWGWRAPLVIADYFRTAFGILGETIFNQELIRAQKQQGVQRLDRHAQQVQVAAPLLDQLLESAQQPTHHSLSRTFYRLYFDRISAAVALAAGGSVLARAGLSLASGVPIAPGLGLLLAAVGGGYLGYSLARHRGRNDWRIPVDQLSQAARLVNQTTGSALTVFGHTHVEVSEPGYLNLGSFGYTRTRPYAVVTPEGRAERFWLGS